MPPSSTAAMPTVFSTSYNSGPSTAPSSTYIGKKEVKPLRKRRKLRWKTSILSRRPRRKRRRVRIRYIYVVCRHCWEEKAKMRMRERCGFHCCHDSRGSDCHCSHRHGCCHSPRGHDCCHGSDWHGCCHDDCCHNDCCHSPPSHGGIGPQGTCGPQKGVAAINQTFAPGVTNGMVNVFVPVFVNTGDATAFNESDNNGYQNTA